jgi:UDP-N-acetyl-D-galactosamine dehydrogenase
VILAGRRINDGMGKYVAEQTVKRMIAAGGHVKGAKVNVLGLAFKENCPDVRNSKAADVVAELRSYGAEVHVHDPVADAEEAQREFGIALERWDALPRAEALVAAVAHRPFLALDAGAIGEKLARGGCFIDVKSQFKRAALEAAGYRVWRL